MISKFDFKCNLYRYASALAPDDVAVTVGEELNAHPALNRTLSATDEDAAEDSPASAKMRNVHNGGAVQVECSLPHSSKPPGFNP
jgi:hypothetical protein